MLQASLIGTNRACDRKTGADRPVPRLYYCQHGCPVSERPQEWRFTDETLRELRKRIPIARERYDFDTIMHRFARLLWEADNNPKNPPAARQPLENENELIREFFRRVRRVKVPAKMRRGRRPLAFERWAALLLAVIFGEFAHRKPSRVWDAYAEAEASAFYAFATASCEALGFKMPTETLRETVKRWQEPDNSEEFHKDNMRRLLWGGLRAKE
jgi:AcrR family transcriptional regulator